MTWVKLDDKFPDHPKIAAAGPSAAWLYVCGLAYCNRMLTDGFIPAGQVRRLADVSNPAALTERLVKADLWHEAPGGYLVHDYLEYQPSRESAELLSRTRADAGRVGGKQTASKLLDVCLDSASSKPQAKPQAKFKPVPVPVPVPHKEKKEEDVLVTIALAEIAPSESTAEDYRTTIDRYRPKLSDDHIERIIYQLAGWTPDKPRRKLHLTLAQWLSKEPRDPLPPSHAPFVVPDATEMSAEERLASYQAGIGRVMT